MKKDKAKHRVIAKASLEDWPGVKEPVFDQRLYHAKIAKASYRRQHGVTDQRPCRDCRVLRDSPRVGRCPPCAKARRDVMRALREGR